MWSVDNRTRFQVGRTFARDMDGAEVWIVAVRGTFTVGQDGSVTLAREQQPVCEAPRYTGEPGRSSLRYEMDVVRTRPGTDVVVHGHAHAPFGRAATAVDVAFSAGPISKRLRVVGDRTWERGLTGLSPGAPRPFVQMPIVYERAWGGSEPGTGACDPFNPVGVGAFAAAGGPVPNCELPDEPIRSSRHRGRPAGLGPIAGHWQPRAALAGTYDEAWRRARRPLLPLDFQDSHLRCAPEDQQVQGFLTGGEEVALLNLTPEGLLCFRLPRVHLGFATRFEDDETVYHHGRVHTVIVEPEARRLVLVWHTSMPCHHTMYSLKETVVYEKRRLPRHADAASAEGRAAR